MKTTSLIAAAIMATATTNFAQDDKKPAAAAAPEATPANVSYAYGTMIAKQLKQMGMTVDQAELAKGISDTLDGKQPRLSQAEAQKVIMAFQEKKMKEDEANAAGAAGKNKEEGAAFLAKNGKREGVTTTKSGLQYEVLKKGDGAKPAATDTVKVHYHGTLLNGTVFDSSVERGEPTTFPLNGVIPGWTEGVQLMNVGSKFKFAIPSDLAYGDRGAGGDIGPGATLIFEVELLAIEGK
jgi:FKBP-type peptidyl-prolyl cis-trans isomerase